MRSFLLAAVLGVAALSATADTASAQVVTYSTPYGSVSYGTPYSTTVIPATPIFRPYVVARPYIVPVAPWYPGYVRPVVRAYYGPVYGWRW
jgi:hypothetical protein